MTAHFPAPQQLDLVGRYTQLATLTGQDIPSDIAHKWARAKVQADIHHLDLTLPGALRAGYARAFDDVDLDVFLLLLCDYEPCSNI